MKLDVLVLVALVALQSALLTFYWSHCAGPALVHAGARSRTLRVVQTVGALSLAGFVIAIAMRLSRLDAPIWLWAVIVGLSVWYMLAWPRPRWVARISGGVDEREALRQRIWRLNWASNELVKASDSPTIRNAVENELAALRLLPRSAKTTPLIEAWLDESEAALEGRSDAAGWNDRYVTIWLEAQRLWPDGETGNVVVPFRQITDPADRRSLFEAIEQAERARSEPA